MLKSYVPDAQKSRPLHYRTRGSGKRRSGWSSEDGRRLGMRRFDRFLIEDWLPSLELELEPNSYSSVVVIVTRHIAPAIGHLRVRDITTSDLRDFYADLLRGSTGVGGRALSKNSVIRVHAAIHRAFEGLVESGIMARNPSDGARPRWRKSDRYEAVIWTSDEMHEFLAAIRGDTLFPLWWLLAFTGMRRGEALAVRWEDVRKNSRSLAVRRAFSEAGGRQYLSAPKGAQSRVITLDPQTLRVLQRHRSHQVRLRQRLGLRPLSVHDYVFTDESGEPLKPNKVSKAFAALIRNSALPVIRLHDLRHTHASHLIEAGASIKAVQERLGHSDVVVTLNIYSHLLPTTQAQAVRALQRFYKSASRNILAT